MHFVSCEMWHEAGGMDVIPVFLEILPKLLLSFDGPVFQLDTVEESLACPGYSPYHLLCDLGGLRNWSIER